MKDGYRTRITLEDLNNNHTYYLNLTAEQLNLLEWLEDNLLLDIVWHKINDLNFTEI